MSAIKIHKPEDIGRMRIAGQLAADVLAFAGKHVAEGITTGELDVLCNEFIIAHGAVSATLGYNGFPGAICTSVNNVVCHGIPGSYRLKSGDIVNIDITVNVDGWHGDTSKTFMVGQCTKLAKILVDVAEQAMYTGIDAVKPYGYFGDIGVAIQKFVDRHGFSIVRSYCGHGIGREFHGEPMVLHYDSHEPGLQILPGMFFTVEPMINAGFYKTKVMKDGWTVVTADKSLSAQFEHTVAVTENSVEIMTGSSQWMQV
ncbi:MAG: type I methionyl aminopeptidase [Holosporales bacterium]|jgi:methionyl aminopeptidase|nr:type I methionyl aminopeptidase [Holosporales bacterium]